MRVALTLVALALGFVASIWLADRVIQLPDETPVEVRLRRHDRWIRRIVAALGCAVTSLLVGVIWLQGTADEAHDATQAALELTETLCRSQHDTWEQTEQNLIADVRLARVTYTANVESLQDAQDRLTATFPSTAGLDPGVVAFVEEVVRMQQVEAQDDVGRWNAAVDRWQNELAIREGTLDAHRASPPVECRNLTVESVTEEPTPTT